MLIYTLCILVAGYVLCSACYKFGGWDKLLDALNAHLMECGESEGLSVTEFKIFVASSLLFAPVVCVIILFKLLKKVFK